MSQVDDNLDALSIEVQIRIHEVVRRRVAVPRGSHVNIAARRHILERSVQPEGPDAMAAGRAIGD